MDDLSGKQLRITSFFQSRKGGACSNDTKEISGITAQGPALDEETRFTRRNSDIHKEFEPSIREEAGATIQVESTFVEQDRSAWEITRATHVGIIHEEYALKVIHGEDPYESVHQQIASTEVGLKADGNRNMMRNSRVKPEVVSIEETNMEAHKSPEVVLIDDVETNVYPYKANRLGNHSPGFQAGRQRMSSDSNTMTQDGLVEIIDVDTTPPLRCWRELYEGKTTDTPDSSKMRSHTKRVLFS